MDLSSSLFQIGENSEFLFDCENLLEQSFSTSDAGYYSACSSLSPASSTDSCCFSPGTVQENLLKSFPMRLDEEESRKKAKRTGRPRSKFPGLKRQNASEREKLRMRDLTKALHHLRTYLPATVAPVGQTLTKIETLRLTIRYISYLSAQLRQEEPTHGDLSPPTLSADAQMSQMTQTAPQTLNFDMSYNQNQGDIQQPMTQDYWLPQREFCFYTQC